MLSIAIILIVASLQFENYGGEYHCWLQVDTPMMFGQIVPTVVLVILIFTVLEAAGAAERLVKDRCFQATAASSVGGAVTLGTAGGVAGLATGATIGGVVGLPLALFTLGLSIPVSATIGGACGLFAGAAAGGTAGAVGGGAAGYGIYQRRDRIAAAMRSGRQELTKMAQQARKYARERANSLRAAFAGGRN